MQSSDAIFEAHRTGPVPQNHGITSHPQLPRRSGMVPPPSQSRQAAAHRAIHETNLRRTQKNGPLAGEPASHDYALSRAASDISLQPRPPVVAESAFSSF